MYTYDGKGDIVFIKNVNPESLSKEVNFELKYSLRKLPMSTKGAYSFDAATFKKRKNSTNKLKDEDDPTKPLKVKSQSKLPIE